MGITAFTVFYLLITYKEASYLNTVFLCHLHLENLQNRKSGY